MLRSTIPGAMLKNPILKAKNKNKKKSGSPSLGRPCRLEPLSQKLGFLHVRICPWKITCPEYNMSSHRFALKPTGETTPTLKQTEEPPKWGKDGPTGVWKVSTATLVEPSKCLPVRFPFSNPTREYSLKTKTVNRALQVGLIP